MNWLLNKLSNKRLMIVVGLLIALSLPFWVQSNYMMGVVNLSYSYAICVIGLWVILGLAGQMSLSQASFFAVGAYTLAILCVKAGMPYSIAIIIAILMSGVAGFVIGAPTLKLSGRYLTITTLGFAIIVELILRNWITLTNGPDGISNIPSPSIFGFNLSTNKSVYYFAFAILMLVIIFAYRIKNSEFGLALQMIRDDELAARACGINTAFYKTMAFIIGGTLGGLGGAVYALVIHYISPGEFSHSQSMVFLVMLVIGGCRSISGAVIGSMLLTLLPEFLKGIKNYHMVIFGLSVVFIVLFLPGGISSAFNKLSELGKSGKGKLSKI